VKSYRRLLGDVDAWYRAVQSRHPDKVTCARGCRDCCLGLFDVSIADRALLREGLAKADAATRLDIQTRAAAIMAEVRKAFPTLGDTLDGLTEEQIDSLCDHLGAVECPVLGREGECRLYEHRPLTCRLAGVPIVDVSGQVVAREGCAKCRLTATEAPRLDCGGMWRREEKCLRALDAERPDVTVLIPQALEPGRCAPDTRR
jgi:Fe-S-cluster containining protein